MYEEKVQLVIQRIQESKEKIKSLENSAKGFLDFLGYSFKDIIGDFDSEDDFISFLAVLIDKLVELPAPYEWFDDRIAKFLLKIVDKQILNKFFGEDWFIKFKKKVLSL